MSSQSPHNTPLIPRYILGNAIGIDSLPLNHIMFYYFPSDYEEISESQVQVSASNPAQVQAGISGPVQPEEEYDPLSIEASTIPRTKKVICSV